MDHWDNGLCVPKRSRRPGFNPSLSHAKDSKNDT